MGLTVVALIGNPAGESRTHRAARHLRDRLAGELDADVGEVDLATLAGSLVDGGNAVDDAIACVSGADVLVVATPTYKATYTGLLKMFIDRLPMEALEGVRAVPLMTGMTARHALAVEVHLVPLLREVGASCAARGIYQLADQMDGYGTVVDDWLAASRSHLVDSPAG